MARRTRAYNEKTMPPSGSKYLNRINCVGTSLEEILRYLVCVTLTDPTPYTGPLGMKSRSQVSEVLILRV